MTSTVQAAGSPYRVTRTACLMAFYIHIHILITYYTNYTQTYFKRNCLLALLALSDLDNRDQETGNLGEPFGELEPFGEH